MHNPIFALCRRGAALAFCVLLFAACSERESSGVKPSQSAETPRIEPSFATEALKKMSSQVAAGGVPTKYDAYFDQQQLKAIIEERQGPTAVGEGEYVFMGARLLQYRGAPLAVEANHGAESIELKFDLQGRLESARALQDEAGKVEQTQIDAIRTRADLLRNHALMQRSVNAHRGEGNGR